MVDLDDVSYRVGDTCILRDVSVAFIPGAFNVVLGPNGAGKSTLLKLATGYLRPSAGRVQYDGRDVAVIDSGELARKRAVLSQHVELAFPLPVRDVVMMGRYPHFRRVPSKQDHAIVQAALELVGMAERASQAYPTLSGGERQKAQLARVLAQIWNYDDASEPKVVFLDEPTTSLDIHFQLHLLDTARSLLDVNCTVVAVLHDLNTAFKYGDVFFLLESGRLVHQAARNGEIARETIERVFRVRAVPVDAPDGSRSWRFSL